MATPIPDNAARFTLGEVAELTGGEVVAGDADTRLQGVVTDSRRAGSGNLYVALVGEHHDGHSFLPSVAGVAGAALVRRGENLPAGLSAVAVDDTLVALGALANGHRRRWGGRIVAITGSAGKTTTKELTASALQHAGRPVARTAGNLNNRIGVPMTLLCLEPETRLAVIEAGMSLPGEMAALASIIEADVAVVTAVAVAHTEGVGSLEAVADEKMALLRALGPQGVAIYSADHPPLRQRAADLVARTLSFGEAQDADVRLVAHTIDAQLRSTCTYAVAGVEAPCEVRLQLLGFGPAVDAAAALCCVLACDGPEGLQRGVAGLQTTAPVVGRLAVGEGAAGYALIDDSYNANPASTAASLRTLAQAAAARGGRSVAVLGDMKELGEQSQEEHARVGRAATELGVGTLIGCGPAMRAAVDAAGGDTRAHHVDDPMDALPLIGAPGASDVVLVKGSRSMAMERVVEALRGEAA